MRQACVPFIVWFMFGACGDSAEPPAPGPGDGLKIDFDLTGHGLSQAVDVIRDGYGVAHLRAQTAPDVAFVQGYLTAHDRMAQMEILRHYAEGSLGELFGALDARVLNTDLEMRMHQLRHWAALAWQTLQTSSDATDRAMVAFLTRYADGVNAYLDALKAARWQLDANIETTFAPSTARPWTPVDSLAIGKYQALALSWNAPTEIAFTDQFQGLRAAFATSTDPARAARRRFAQEFMTIAPPSRVATDDEFLARAHIAQAARPPARRHALPAGHRLLQDALAFFSPTIYSGPLGTLGPHAFMSPHAGSNNWVVGPSLAGGQTLLAGDQHLSLANPSVFYPIHLATQDGLDVIGVSFPGIPGVILGANGRVAWTSTVAEHDVNDVYREQVTPCPGGQGDCVRFQGTLVPIQTRRETLRIGALGTITSSKEVVYETVPHHGPIIPTIDRQTQTLKPRTGAAALSVRYTGHQPTFEFKAVWKLMHATDVGSGMAALADFSVGAQNWVFADAAGHIGWSTQALVPRRPAAAYTWHATAQPTGLAPFMILPGTGEAEWQGYLPASVLPHGTDTPRGYYASANSDPVGANFDNDPLNQRGPDGAPWYVGFTYATGLRTERISTLLEQGPPAGHTLASLAAIQHNTTSNVGGKLRAPLVAALTLAQGPNAPRDVEELANQLSAAQRQRLATAYRLLAGWTLATPAALGQVDAQTQQDSAATALFNTWMHFLLPALYDDELALAQAQVWNFPEGRVLRTTVGLLTTPASYSLHDRTAQPVICDDLRTAVAESCTRIMLSALLAAMEQLESSKGYGTADTSRWRWGEKHRLIIKPLFPNPALQLPTSKETAPELAGGFARAGDNSAVNFADHGWSDLNFAQIADGPAQRFLVAFTPGQPMQVKWQIPGGTRYDSRSQHYRDLLDRYYLREVHFSAPYIAPEVAANGKERWRFQ